MNVRVKWDSHVTENQQNILALLNTAVPFFVNCINALGREAFELTDFKWIIRNEKFCKTHSYTYKYMLAVFIIIQLQ